MVVRFVAALSLAAAVCAPAASARAGIYGDGLARCLVERTSEADQVDLITWMFAMMSAHPDVRAYANVTDAQRQAFSMNAGKIMQRLLTETCRKDAIAALKYEGPGVIEPAFSVLGQVAMRGLMTDPAVTAGMADLAAGMDATAIEALATEAGLPQPPTAAPKS